MSLFRSGDFTLHSGEQSSFKIDCDEVTSDEWHTLAAMLAARVPPFNEVVGVPSGGLRLAVELGRFSADAYLSTGKVLIVDDVFTTGASIDKCKALHMAERRHLLNSDFQAAVVFARTVPPPWIRALFQLAPELRVLGEQSKASDGPLAW